MGPEVCELKTAEISWSAMTERIWNFISSRSPVGTLSVYMWDLKASELSAEVLEMNAAEMPDDLKALKAVELSVQVREMKAAELSWKIRNEGWNVSWL